ncbi:hypothetical protein JOC70_000120 [Clostridium pascui]|uniref:hypothetical protein n=1 Tax=Clostridium pascui TaxID=46609 RepID=UPI001957B050|nr:hypothetical protein [Clostridium pascui]MBM7868651.1 hypothetical protein [Clostridium pascui]
MKKVMVCLLFIAIGIICFYFAFQDNTSATLGISLKIVGTLSFGIGFYKSWRNGILASILEFVLDLFCFWP